MTTEADSRAATERSVAVWDPLIRIGHWLLVAGFATAYLTEGEPEWLHSYAGYAVATVVAVRILWGFVGPRRAQFSDFVTGPGRVLRYFRDLLANRAERHVGHSPTGGAMTVALLFALAFTTLSGMATLAAEEERGPLAGIVTAQTTLPGFVSVAFADEDGYGNYREHDEDEEESLWMEIHEVATNLTLILVLLHVGGVALASRAHGENLVRAMIDGRKRP